MRIPLNLFIMIVWVVFVISLIPTVSFFSYKKYAFAQVIDKITYDKGRTEGCADIIFKNGRELSICAGLIDDIYKIQKGDSIYKPVDNTIIFIYRKNKENRYTLIDEIKK